MTKLLNSKGKGLLYLPIESTIYVPSTNKNQKQLTRILRRKRVNEVRRYLSNNFGGYTSVNATGGWVMKNKKLVREPVVKVTAFSKTYLFNKNKKPLVSKIKNWGRKWGQEAVSFEHEGDLFIYNTSRIKKRRKR